MTVAVREGRTPRQYVAKDGVVTWKVPYRIGGKYSSETFRSRQHADTFAVMLGRGDRGVIDALAWVRAMEEQAEQTTFAEFFEHFVDQLTGIEQRTRDDYRDMKRRHLTELDALPLPLITRTHITSIVNRLEREGKKPKTIENVIHMLASCLSLAVDEGHIAKNPCKRVRLPKEDHEADDEARFLTHDEFARFLDCVPAQWRPLVVFLVGTGLRWSEATALQARHVDMVNGTVRVQQAWKRVKSEGKVIGRPKSPKSRRTVNAAVMALAAVEPLLRGPGDFVFVSRQGRPINHSNFYARVWKPACKASGLDPQPRIHDLRHTHASWLISDGMSLEQVQDQLGHESILTTRKVYGHLLPALGVEVGRSASAALERALPNGIGVPLALPRDAAQS